MKVAIVGSRGFLPLDAVGAWMRCSLPRDTIVVSGGARGVDLAALEQAHALGMVTVVYAPEWRRPDGTINRGAGFARNQLIVDQADRVVAFWDGQSRGTLDTIRRAAKAGKPVTLVRWEGTRLLVMDDWHEQTKH